MADPSVEPLADTELADTDDDGGSDDPSPHPVDAGDTLAGQGPRPWRLGRYRLGEPLGRGGMGVVYEAQDEELDRRVALKFIGQRGDAAAAAARLLDEAQAMARLDHPNVIHVYEVGVADGQVYIAMERVVGVHLRAWHTPARRWTEIVAMYLQAGRGLAAAHRAGVLHCDFKPENVLVGDDGRARVLDFGLARRHAADDPAPAHAAAGTHGYMPREVYECRPIDARSDQFAFCVALFEALFGQRPFIGATNAAIRRAVVLGQLTPAPAEASVPARLRRAVRRGLATEPDARHPSMDALLTELEAALPRSRAWLLAGFISAALTAAIASAARGLDDPAARCAAVADDELGVHWGPAPRAAIARAFAATNLPYAADSFARTATLLDERAEEWLRARRLACERAHDLAAPTDLDRARARCLDRRRSDLGAWIDALRRADAATVEGAVEATINLASADSCSDTNAADARTDLDPANAPEAGRIDGLLAAARAAALASRGERGLDPAREAVAAARRLGDIHREAEALLVQGSIERDSADGPVATATLTAAFFAGEAARDPRLRAEAALHLAYVTRGDPRLLSQADTWSRHVEAIAAGLGESGRDLQGALHRQRGRAAIAVRRYEDAIRDLDEALRLESALVGPEHPRIAQIQEDRGDALGFLDRTDEALEALDRALAVALKDLGPYHPSTARRVIARGKILERLGRLDEALESYERGLDVWERTYGLDHPRLIWALTCIGRIHMKARRFAPSEAAYARALAIAEAHHGPDQLQTAYARNTLGVLLRRAGRVDEARALQERALTAFEASAGETAPLARALIELGEDAIDRGDRPRALTHLERARRVQSDATNTPDELARTEFALARARWLDPADRPAALLNARAAVAHYALAGPTFADDRAAATTWLAAAEAYLNARR